jgi:hypothetical protein
MSGGAGNLKFDTERLECRGGKTEIRYFIFTVKNFLLKGGLDMLRTPRIVGFWLALIVVCSLLGCASIAPPRVQVRSLLTPLPEQMSGEYTLEEDGVMVFKRQGMKVTVRSITDEELNAMYPEHSQNGTASTNPYTYADWVDPELGYTPNRFTVFRVTVHNYALPKINLNPIEAVLVSDRGDQLKAYLREAGESENSPSMEDYYRERMGRTGVEEYRFVERMGMVRQTLYVNGKAFKGDVKEGFLVFDPLDPRVKKVDLVLKNFVLAYDANDWPAEQVDLTFPFERTIVENTEIKE